MARFSAYFRQVVFKKRVAAHIRRQLPGLELALTESPDPTGSFAILWGVQCEGLYHEVGMLLEPMRSWRQGIKRLKTRRRQTLNLLTKDLAQSMMCSRNGSVTTSTSIAVAQLVTQGPDDTIRWLSGFSVECTPAWNSNVTLTPYLYSEPWSTSLGVTRFIMHERIKRRRPFICI